MDPPSARPPRPKTRPPLNGNRVAGRGSRAGGAAGCSRRPPETEASLPAVARALAQRGLSVIESCAAERTFLPLLRTARARRTFFLRLHSYAFRLFLRDLLTLRDRYCPSRLGPFFSPASIEEMARDAERLGFIRRAPGGAVRLLAEQVTDFGDTFEWFVAELLKDQFAADALWGVKVAGLSCGGDFDVLAVVSGRLLYIETKTSPPKHIEQKEIDAFLARVAKLSPDMAILLVDTHLRMKDKLVPLLSEALRREGVADPQVERVENETFGWRRHLFLTNSKRDVAANVALCLRSYFLDRFFG